MPNGSANASARHSNTHTGRPRLALRWTIGDVTPRGFEALHLSLWGAWKVFGSRATYHVVVNSMAVNEALSRVRPPGAVRWRAAGPVPSWLAEHLGAGMAEGVAWKLVPPRIQLDCPELSLDNDVILWDKPRALSRWLRDAGSVLLAADVALSFGVFARHCGGAPLNTGIRGLPPRLDPEPVFRRMLVRHARPLESELDEQGLQIAALRQAAKVVVVPTEEVSICSPFPPHQPALGRCGAHFVGINTRHFGWRYYERPAEEVRAEHWDHHREQLYARVRAPPLAGKRRRGT